MSTPLQEEIHGHAVLQMMSESDRTFSRQSLIEAIRNTFGEQARFYICSGGGMDAEELVDTLIAKGKFQGPADAFQFNPQAMCDH
ncbi:YecH family protein [Ruficoccus amylovorans]|uniref:YecH family protein n=1 Tax=Ruficoccus amylovorans TaxID=1804625 RepID=A0A842HBP2_9BACT|nr:YecH family metal-binding protein [Ruficoccus amylovorans]MBC2593037.1 YecH family protein [Ruficoccus amylovorans]